jgi:hypothetical protein
MSDEVSDFLRSVERLKERREEEDEARSRELEEKILQEKRERQARRAGTPSPILCFSTPPQKHTPHHGPSHRIRARAFPDCALEILRHGAVLDLPCACTILAGWKC